MLQEINKDYTSLFVFPNLRYSSNYFEQIYRAEDSSMLRTAITLKFKMFLKQTNKQQQRQRLKKINRNVHRLV